MSYITSNYPQWITGSVASNSSSTSGALRWNNNSYCIEVDCGSHTAPFTMGGTQLLLSQELVDILGWAKNKMIQEKNMQYLYERQPHIKELQDQLDVAIALSKDYE